MSRSGYTDECDHVHLWRQAVRSAIWGKRGQSLLREMRDVMNAMPEKRLIADAFQNEQGEVCAIATVMAARGLPMDDLKVEDSWTDDNEVVADRLNVATALVQEIEFLNDERCDDKTPEERYEWMLGWVNNHLYKEEVA